MINHDYLVQGAEYVGFKYVYTYLVGGLKRNPSVGVAVANERRCALMPKKQWVVAMSPKGKLSHTLHRT